MNGIKLIKTDTITIAGNPVPCWCYEMTRGDKLMLPRVYKRDFVLMKKGKHKKEYIRLYCGFDIETTNVIIGDEKLAFMYIWQFIVATSDKAFVYLGRTWDDFRYLLETLAAFYNVSRETRVIIWDANFSFEFQFIRSQIDFAGDEYEFFAKEMRKPLLATCYDGLEFRDCLSISGGSLAMLAKDYCTTQKLVGDLDYDIPRNSHTVLTREELNYCINDVKILAEFSFFAFETWIIPFRKVPLTKTGILRNEVKREYAAKCKDKKQYESMLLSCFPKQEEYYKWFNFLFRGGFVHANFYYSNEEIRDVLMYDITSSYPAQMLLNYYPVSPFLADEYSPEKLSTHCCIMLVDFYGIEATTYHSIESKHKVIASEGAKLDNGRIYYADYMRVMLTELDLENYRLFYRWREMRVIEFKTAKRGFLPPFLTDVLKRHYVRKSELKRNGGANTPEYAIVKSGVNSFFGMTVTRINLDSISYNGDWILTEHDADYDKEIEKQLLLPQWGIYVSAWGRHELLATVHAIESEVPNAVIYCDTDSIKCVHDARIDGIIQRYNKTIAEKLKRRKLQNGAFSDLGMFDLEYGKPVTRLKTLGAKRYIYEVDGEYHCTIAGLPKDVLPKVTKDIFKDFDMDGIVIPLEYSEKLTTCYNDSPTAAVIDGELMRENTSVSLYAIPFSLFTDKDYYDLVITAKENERSYLTT